MGTGTLMGKLVKRMAIEHTYRRDLPLKGPEIAFGTGSALYGLETTLKLQHADAAAQKYFRDLAASVNAHGTH
jgi:hypothetical protein